MPTYVFKDVVTAYATLSAGINDTVTTVPLTAGSGTNLPAPTGGDLGAARIDNEGITFTGNDGTTLTGVTRGAFAGPAAIHGAGRQVKNVIPADFLNSVGSGGGGGVLVSHDHTGPADGGVLSRDQHDDYLEITGIADPSGGGVSPLPATGKKWVYQDSATGVLTSIDEFGDITSLDDTILHSFSGAKHARFVQSLSANTTLGPGVDVAVVDASGGAVVITLHALSSEREGQTVLVKKVDSSVNTVTVQRGSTDTIEGATSLSLTAQHSSALLVATTVTGQWRIAALRPSTGGTVTSVALTVPTGFAVSGSPVTSSGTLAVTENTQSANTVKAGPTSGGAATPGYRALVPADYPAFVASGGSHAAGAVPDPGSSAGSTRFLREDATWQVPAGGGGTGTTAVLLDYALASDLAAPLTLTSGTWTDIIGNQSFTVGATTSNVEVDVSGYMAVVGTDGSQRQCALRLVIDSAGTPVNKMLSGQTGMTNSPGYAVNPLAGAGTVSLGSLSAAAHTVKLQGYSNGANASLYCRPATFPNGENFQLRVFERK